MKTFDIDAHNERCLSNHLKQFDVIDNEVEPTAEENETALIERFENIAHDYELDIDDFDGLWATDEFTIAEFNQFKKLM